jgi:hypothetical protein
MTVVNWSLEFFVLSFQRQINTKNSPVCLSRWKRLNAREQNSLDASSVTNSKNKSRV